MKDYGLRTYCNIYWTGNPVKCLGVYIGHKREKCESLNWNKKLNVIEKVLQQWNKRKLTMFGKVNVIKTYALSKIVYISSVIETPQYVISKLKNLFFQFLWNGKDKVTRTNVIHNKINGGLNMIDVESFITSMQVAWVKRLIYAEGKWADSTFM